MAWRLLEHTADVGIEAEAPDAGTCLADAGLALTRLLTGHPEPAALGQTLQEAVRIEAPDLGSLAVAFLSELVWLRESRDLLWTGGAVAVEPAGEVIRATAQARLLRHDAARHGAGVEVKAVTYHRLHFGPEDGMWRLRVFLDL
ncbi:MAG TPA: archease [Candidatus Thermoplasmatota archaeon]|nr:archease [Candidatus Thermoplasmatota archaeon]